VAAMTKGCSTHPREEYWAEERIQVKTISPEQRLENGIKTHRSVPSTFKLMEDAIEEDCFAIIDRSEQALGICTHIHMLLDPNVPQEARIKRYQRFCVDSPAHDPYGKADPSKRYLPVRRSPRLKENASTPQYVPTIPDGCEQITQGGVPCHSGILRAVETYGIWAYGAGAKNIFQMLKEGGLNSPGDTLRKEIKLNLLPEVMCRLPEEDDDHLYDRQAGRAWLLIDLDESYKGFYQVLKLTDVHCNLDPIMASALFADARETLVGRQDQHTDKRPEDQVRAYAVLSSVSSARAGKANIGVKRNSAFNIKILIILRRHFPEFCVLFQKLMAEKLTMENFEIGWNIVCKLFKDENPYEFKVMSDVEIQLLPFEYLVFDTDLIHWGGPYCQSGYLNLRYHL
jgi:hypothetical protein